MVLDGLLESSGGSATALWHDAPGRGRSPGLPPPVADYRTACQKGVGDAEKTPLQGVSGFLRARCSRERSSAACSG